MNEDNRIYSSELAAVFADAEIPFREIAIIALRNGDKELAQTVLHDASIAGITAGRQYLNELGNVVAYYEKGLEQPVLVGLSEFTEFEHKGSFPKTTGQRAWNILLRGHLEHSNLGIKFIRRTDVPALPASIAQGIVRLDLKSLAIAVESIQKMISDNPRNENMLSELLGRMAGRVTLEFLKAFVEEHLETAVLDPSQE